MSAEDIAFAYELIRENGVMATLRTRSTDGAFDPQIGDRVTGGVKASEATLGTIAGASAGKTLTVTAGNLVSAGFAAGQRVKLMRGDGGLNNRGPFTVTAASALVLTVSEAVADMAAVDDFWLYAAASAPAEQSMAVVLTDPGGFRGSQFATGELALHEHTGFLASARAITTPPAPGDRITLPDGSAYTVIDLTALRPAGAAIIWSILAKGA